MFNFQHTSCTSIAFSLFLKEVCWILSKGGWVYYKDNIENKNKLFVNFATELLWITKYLLYIRLLPAGGLWQRVTTTVLNICALVVPIL